MKTIWFKITPVFLQTINRNKHKRIEIAWKNEFVYKTVLSTKLWYTHKERKSLTTVLPSVRSWGQSKIYFAPVKIWIMKFNEDRGVEMK